MVRLRWVTLIVPSIVLDEFRRNRERIAKESTKTLSAHFRLVKDAVGKIGGDKRRTRVLLSDLDDVDHKIPIVRGTAANTFHRLKKQLKSCRIIAPSYTHGPSSAQRR